MAVVGKGSLALLVRVVGCCLQDLACVVGKVCCVLCFVVHLYFFALDFV